MSPSIKLTYFNYKGRGEVIRVAFAYGGIEYVDNRLDSADWPTLKPTFPFQQVPILEVNGTVYTQSYSMLRYAGKLAGLYPEDPEKALRVDEVAHVVDDMLAKVTATLYIRDEAAKKAERERLTNVVFPATVKVLEGYAANGYFSDKISIADIAMYEIVGLVRSGLIDHVDKELFESFPNIVALVNTVENHPKLKDYYATRN
eukprot:CFRG6571T1